MAYDNRYNMVGARVTGSDSTGDKVIFTIPEKSVIERVGMTIEGTEATALVVAFDRRPTAGSDTSRGTADVGEITLPASDVQGKAYYEDVTDTQGSKLIVDEGDQVVVEVTTASSSAKNFVPWMILTRAPEVVGNNSAMVSG